MLVDHDGSMVVPPFERKVGKADADTPILDGACTLVDFWRWAFSDLVTNEMRGVFAEFIVGHALGVLGAPRESWGAWDLTYESAKIEVKATGDVQAWAPTGRPPKPTWGIGKRRGWDATTGTYAPAPIRSADLYVLCHWQGRDASPLSPALLELWNFYVVSTKILNDKHNDRGNLSMTQLNLLLQVGDATPASYSTLRNVINQMLPAESIAED